MAENLRRNGGKSPCRWQTRADLCRWLKYSLSFCWKVAQVYISIHNLNDNHVLYLSEGGNELFGWSWDKKAGSDT